MEKKVLGIRIEIEGGLLGIEKFLKIKEYMQIVPNGIIKKLIENDISIHLVTNKTMRKEGKEKKVIGFYDSIRKVIYIRILQKENSFKETFFHEIGHFVDNYIGVYQERESKHYSLSPYFLEIASEEANVLSQYHRSNIFEVFAQSFALYMQNNKTINSMPKIKILMASVIGYMEAI